jgi:DNA-binding CsgD family transcriptional regulator
MFDGRALVRFSPDDRAGIRSIEDRLARLPIDAPAVAPFEDDVLEEIGALLRCGNCLAFRPARSALGGWGYGDWVSTDKRLCSRYDAIASARPARFAFDPRLPAASQRNRALLLRDVHVHGPDETCEVEEDWPKVGVAQWDQLRVLVCEGPRLLAWIGGLRQEPFSERDRAVLSALVPALRRASRLRRLLLDSSLAIAALDVAMEVLSAPAFVTYADGRVAHANSCGAALVDRDPGGVAARARKAIHERSGRSLAVRLDAPGLPDRWLVVLREENSDREDRLRASARLWATTRREKDVLRCVISGASNKEIALELGVHEGTVERHVTSLLRKAKADGRARLVARFWTMR